MRRWVLAVWMTLCSCRTVRPPAAGEPGLLEVEEAELAGATSLRLSLRLTPVPSESPTGRRGPSQPLLLTLLARPGRNDEAEVLAQLQGEMSRYGECQELSALADGNRVRLAQPRYFAQTEPGGSVTEQLRSATQYEGVEQLARAAQAGVKVCRDAFVSNAAQQETLRRFLKEWSARRR